MKKFFSALFFCLYLSSNAYSQQSHFELDSLYDQAFNSGKYDQARLYGEQCLKVAEQLKSDSLISSSKADIALALMYLGDYDKAEKAYLDAIDFDKKTVGVQHERYAMSLIGLADLYRLTARSQEAETMLNTSLKILRKSKEYEFLAYCLSRLGNICHQNSRGAEAEAYYSEGRSILEKHFGKKRQTYWQLSSALGITYWRNGKYEKAEALLLEAKENIKLLFGPENIDYTEVLFNLGLLYKDLNRIEEALDITKEVCEIDKKTLGINHINYALDLNNLGLLYVKLEKYKEAVNAYKESLSIIDKQLGILHPYYTTITNNLASCYNFMGSYKEAESLFEETKKRAIKVRDTSPALYAHSLVGLGQAFEHQERYDGVFNMYKEAANIFEALVGPQHPFYTNAVNCQANNLLKTGQLDSALFYASKAIETNAVENFKVAEGFEKLVPSNYHHEELLMESLNTMSKILMAQYKKEGTSAKLEQHYTLCKAVMKINEKIRNKFSSDESKLRILKDNSNFAGVAIKNVLLFNRPELQAEAFEFAEQNKSVLLAEALKSTQARSLSNLPDSLVREEKSLQKEADELQKAILQTKDAESKNTLLSKNNELAHKISLFKKMIESKYPQYYRLKYSNVSAKAADIQKLLDKKSLFLEYFIGNTESFLFVISVDKVQIIPIEIDIKTISDAIKDLRHALSNYEFIKKEREAAHSLYVSKAYWFYQTFLAPALNEAKGIEHLIIVPDGELGHLPFEAFLTEKVTEDKGYQHLPYLLRRYSVSYNYSATLWKDLLQQPQKSSKNNMLAMAASYKIKNELLLTARSGQQRSLREGLQDLPAAKQEVNTLAEAFSGFFAIDSASNDRDFKSKAADHGIIHLAMHGLLNKRNPILSSLAFTENGDSTEDNFLEAWEISHLKLNAQLVVLSACETGYGKFQQGEGVMSLARSFMYAGVPSLVVSLWQVNDASTSTIMQLFYKNLAKGMNKSEALRAAKLSYMSSVDNSTATHPAFWAPFILIGDDRSVHLATKGGGMWWWIVGSVALLVVVGGVFALRGRKEK